MHPAPKHVVGKHAHPLPTHSPPIHSTQPTQHHHHHTHTQTPPTSPYHHHHRAPDNQEHSSYRIGNSRWVIRRCANDPSAGSPTETLLRLLLPLSDKVHKTLCSKTQVLRLAAIQNIHRITQSVGATGGVYKGQGRNQHKLMTHTY